ncbi:MAG: hypothetical protein AAF517_03275 [Planctomycetota bacterium]
MQKYTHGKYSVSIADDGAIRVQKGDWLSKYSAAMYGGDCFRGIREYGRRDARGQLVPIADLDRIYTGETVYHRPTFLLSQHRSKSNEPTPAPKPQPEFEQMTEQEKRRHVETLLRNEYGLKGQRLKTALKVLDFAGPARYSLLSLEAILLIIAEEGIVLAVVSAAGSLLAIGGALLSVPANLVKLQNAWETKDKFTGMMAIAYATTAWAFNDPMPGPHKNVRKIKVPSHRARCIREWHEVGAQTWGELEKDVVERGTSKQAYQLALRAVGDGDRKKLAEAIFAGFKSDLDQVEQVIHKNITMDYPN